MKTYYGRRKPTTGREPIVARLYTDGTWDALPQRRDLVDHSGAFEWGYGGSGPAQLALSLLADATGNEEWALEHAEVFKELVVAEMPEEWRCTQQQILDWVESERRRTDGVLHPY